MIGALKHSAHSFIINMGTKAPAFVLADEGYDVWVGNTRGNYLSRNHTTLNPNSDAYWDFTVEEIAEVDLPAFIQYIQGVTGAARISYLGYAQGATSMVNLAARKPEIEDDINVAIAWMPQAGKSTYDSNYFRVSFNGWIMEVLKSLNVKIIGDWPSTNLYAVLAQAFPTFM